ncbi:MAG: hypothetical protein VKK59_04165 [Vampirovibrionales bacterium]|nr:hypothetical protein [Vampirovibrionales bacterium]
MRLPTVKAGSGEHRMDDRASIEMSTPSGLTSAVEQADIWPEQLLMMLEQQRSVLAEMEIALMQKQDALLMMAPDALLASDATLTRLAKCHHELEMERQALMRQVTEQLGFESVENQPLTLSGVSQLLASYFPNHDFSLRLSSLKQTLLRQARRIQQLQDHHKSLLKITRQWIAGASAFYQELLAHVLHHATTETGYTRPASKSVFATQPVFQRPLNTRDEVI